MRWLRCGLWIAVWGAWAWLGTGLYRELPRDLGPAACSLSLAADDEFLGFVPAANLAVSVIKPKVAGPCAVRLWDMKTGNLASTIDGPVHRPNLFHWTLQPFLRHAMLIARERPSPSNQPPATWSVVNLLTGIWTDLPEPKGFSKWAPEVFAPSAPRVLLRRDRRREPRQVFDGVPVAADPDQDWDWQIRVVDLTDGRTLLRVDADTAGEPRRHFIGAPFFIDDDTVAIETSVDDADGKEGYHLELWRLDAPDRPTKVIVGLQIGDDPVASRTGRVSWHVPGIRPAHVDVYDLNAEKTLLAEPPPKERSENPGGTGGAWLPPVLSSDGRWVLVMGSRRLWDVDLKEVAKEWPDDVRITTPDSAGRFEVEEQWPPSWFAWMPQFKTFALRDLAGGRLIYRTRVSTWPREWSTNDAREWHIDDDNVVYPLPPAVNWQLLLFCQSVLALPLILLWLALLWRRKRRARRLAGATA